MKKIVLLFTIINAFSFGRLFSSQNWQLNPLLQQRYFGAASSSVFTWSELQSPKLSQALILRKEEHAEKQRLRANITGLVIQNTNLQDDNKKLESDSKFYKKFYNNTCYVLLGLAVLGIIGSDSKRAKK